MERVPSRKRCETCVFHRAGPSPCTGVCLNRTWQPRTDASRLVRDRELACYRGWGDDLWSPKTHERPDDPAGPSANGGGHPPKPTSPQVTRFSSSGPAIGVDHIVAVIPYNGYRFHHPVDELLAVSFLEDFH